MRHVATNKQYVQGLWSARWLKPQEKAQAESERVGDGKTRILVKTLVLKLELVANTLVQTVPDKVADAKATTLQDIQGGGREKNY